MREHCDMKMKLNCGLIVILLIFGAMVTCWNAEFKADKPDSNPKDISGNDPKSISNGLMAGSQIQVISEPVFGQNFNTAWSTHPRIAVENDKIYVVWQDMNNTNGAGSSWDIFYRHYDGNSWGDIQVISEPIFGQNSTTDFCRYPDIAVENGKIYIVWEDWNNVSNCGGGFKDSEIFFRCNLTGSGWEDIQIISEPIAGQNINIGASKMPVIEVENGSIYIVWTDKNDTNNAGNDWDIFFNCNLTGKSWEPVQVISEPVVGQNFNTGDSCIDNPPSIAVENSNIYVAWDDKNDTNGAGEIWETDIFYRCNVTKSEWEDIQVISEPVFGQDFNTAASTYPKIVVENSKIYVVWFDSNDTNGAGSDSDVFYKCNITGMNWELVQVISEPIFGQNYNTDSWTHGLDIAVENGNIYVVWDDMNNTKGSGNSLDISLRVNSNGSNWGPIEVPSEPIYGKGNSMGSKLPAITVKKSKIHIVWDSLNMTNGAGSDNDILYRWVNFPSLFFQYPKVSPIFGNTSTEFNFTVIYRQLNNSPPSRMKVKIDGIEHTMLEVDQTDTNYTNGKKYYFSIKNLDIGTHTYEFNTSDGTNFTNTQRFRDLEVVNTFPKIITEDNLTAIEDQYYEVNYEFEDMDMANVGQSCHWEFATNAGWLSFNIATGVVSGTPVNDDVGKHWVDIAINDTIDIFDTNFTLTVLEINDDPIIETTNIEQTNEDELYQVDYFASDIDSKINKQIWSFETNASSWLYFSSPTRTLNGTPGNDEVGTYWINITVNDTEGGFDFTNFTLTVLNVNDGPVMIVEEKLYAESDQLYQVKFNATDIDSPRSEFNWKVETNATWLSIDTKTGLLTGTPKRSDAGWYDVNVTINDGDGGIDWHEYILTVFKGNLPPIITNVDVESAKVNASYQVDYNATDDRAIYLLEWYLKTNASWLNIDSETGILNGTPTTEDGGRSYWINISVLDSELGMDYHNFTIEVAKAPKVIIKNTRPELRNFKIFPSQGDTNTEFTFSVTYIDADEDKPDTIQVVIDEIAFDLTLKSGGLLYHGIYEYTTTLSEGEHSYYFTASDGKDTNTSETFTTPKIEKPKEIEDDGTKKESQDWVWLILIIVIIVIVVLIVIFILNRKKKEEPEEITQPEPTQQEISIEQPTAPISPEPPAQAPLVYPEYRTEEPMVREDLYTPPLDEEGFETLEE